MTIDRHRMLAWHLGSRTRKEMRPKHAPVSHTQSWPSQNKKIRRWKLGTEPDEIPHPLVCKRSKKQANRKRGRGRSKSKETPRDAIQCNANAQCKSPFELHRPSSAIRTTSSSLPKPLQYLNRILQLVLENNDVPRPRRTQITHLEPSAGGSPVGPAAESPSHAIYQPTRNAAHDPCALERQSAQIKRDGDLFGPVFAKQDVFATSGELG